MPGLQLNLL